MRLYFIGYVNVDLMIIHKCGIGREAGRDYGRAGQTPLARKKVNNLTDKLVLFLFQLWQNNLKTPGKFSTLKRSMLPAGMVSRAPITRNPCLVKAGIILLIMPS